MSQSCYFFCSITSTISRWKVLSSGAAANFDMYRRSPGIKTLCQTIFKKIAMAETHAKIPLDPTRFSRSGLGPAAVLERLKAGVLEMPRAGGRYMRVFDERCFFFGVLGVFLPSLRFIWLSVLGLLWRFYVPLFHEFGWCLRETFVVSVYFGGVDSWRLLQDRPCYTSRLGWSWGEPGSPRQPGPRGGGGGGGGWA